MGVGTPTAAETAAWVASVLPHGTHVRPLASQRRALAVIHDLELISPDGDVTQAVAKCTVASIAGSPPRPNLARRSSTPSEGLEQTAAVRLHDLMRSVDGVRAPGVIASRTSPPTLVLERLTGATDLTRLLRRAAVEPTSTVRRRIEAAYAAAGRAAQRMAEAGPLPHRETSHPTSGDLLTTAGEMAAFLGDTSADLAGAAVRRAEELLERASTWPIVAGHSDFAPRNVLVLGDGIGVIDALFALNVPRFEDAARFVVNTLAPLAEIPVPAPGRRRIGPAVVETFLAECVVPEDRPLFEATCLVVALDRWCALAAGARGSARMRLRARTGLRVMPGVVRMLLERTE